ncbi:hypothetical protein C5610_04895 [Idiomarina sp. OT37-5b]|uniref:hypothetical protein n=1 Tax=Idiomarina sp. OT37-5b TaxID=2100422 RepID=UPI000CFA5433|nr:hypothetical protein [Idiomarina sp. OT37-5b]AVJ55708.1 hypothetical protein C5610_04895 [Idiomarina sp. OT37-5b]
MLRIRLCRPQRLLSVDDSGQHWLLQQQSYGLAGQPLVVWRWLLIVPLQRDSQRYWLWLWWFQLRREQLAQLRCLSMLAAQRLV